VPHVAQCLYRSDQQSNRELQITGPTLAGVQYLNCRLVIPYFQNGARKGWCRISSSASTSAGAIGVVPGWPGG
jgi:hypothetical protein